MPDSPKRLILAKGHCGICQSPVSVEVEEPAPLVQFAKEPCKCGRTENERVARWFVFGAITLIISFTGSCITNQYFTTQQVKAMTEKYQVRPSNGDDKRLFNEPDYVVEPKKDQKK